MRSSRGLLQTRPGAYGLPPLVPIFVRLLLLASLLFSGCNCGEEDGPAPTPMAPPQVGTPAANPAEGEAQTPWPADPRQVTVHDAGDLARLDLGIVEHLDLALSSPDRVGFIDEGSPEDGCAGLDLVKLAGQAPRLVSLRVSGCLGAVQSGLGAFAPQLTQLELADMRIDGVIVGRLAQLVKLEQLSLRRVSAGSEPLTPLRKLDLQAVRLSELPKDSEISLILDLWPRKLRSVVLEGNWAGHKAMLTLAKADALERLELRDTRIGNFSLNQIKPLDKLREVVFSGSTFNDNSPLYFRELPIKSFECDCPRMGDYGLRSLRYSTGIRKLQLRGTKITGEGLKGMEDLVELETLVLTGIDIGPKGLEALSTFPKLRKLQLSGELDHPSMEKLSLLTNLEALVLDYPTLDDRAMPELAALIRLKTLDLGNTDLSDDGLASLSALSSLDALHLHHTRVTNRGLASLSALSSLRVLELDHTDVVDAGIQHLVPLTGLEVLRLDHTLVTDAAIEHIVKLRALRRLNLSHTVVTREGVAPLSGLPELETLGLDGTRALTP